VLSGLSVESAARIFLIVAADASYMSVVSWIIKRAALNGFMISHRLQSLPGRNPSAALTIAPFQARCYAKYSIPLSFHESSLFKGLRRPRGHEAISLFSAASGEITS
jgi:hypothetical protein